MNSAADISTSLNLPVANSDAVHVTLLDLFLQHCFLALVSKKQLLSIYLVTTVLVYKPLQMYVATQSILYLTYYLLNCEAQLVTCYSTVTSTRLRFIFLSEDLSLLTNPHRHL